MNINSRYITAAIELIFLILILGIPLYRFLKGMVTAIKSGRLSSSPVKEKTEKKQIAVSPEKWMKKVYDTVSEVNLWSHKLSYNDYLKAIEKYSKEFSRFPSEDDLKNPANFTRGIFMAIDENILYGGGFDYESGYEDLLETFERLFKKAKIQFSWKKINDSFYTYEIDNAKYDLDLSQEEEADRYEVIPNIFVDIESNITKVLQKQGLYLVNTHTGDQTADYVLLKKEYFSRLKELFPNSEDYQVIIEGEVKNL